jgi:hypothetical protein
MNSQEMGGAVGELTLVEASLGALLVDIREAIREHGPVKLRKRNLESATTGQLARELLAVVEKERALFPADLGNWLEAVKTMVEQRNAVVHAIGRDRCITCGDSSVFEHKGKAIDRSPERIRELITECQALIDRGVELASELSTQLNERLLSEAVTRAHETNEPQAPAQVKIGGISHQCARCHETGSAAIIVAAPAAKFVLPPGADPRTLFGKGGSATPVD